MRRREGHTRRRLKRASSATVLLAALWLVPAASAAGYDPLSVDAAGSTDPIPLDNPAYQCPFQYVNAPKGFTPPTGLPDATECVIILQDGTDPSKFIKSPQTQTLGVGTLGVAGAPHAAQWIKIPTATSVAVVPLHFEVYPSPPPGEPAGTATVYHFYPRVWFLSADRKRVGEMPPFRVRTLAFGSVPVQVTVHLTQPRAADGSVEPIEVEQGDVTPVNGVFPGSDGSGRPISQIFRNAYGKGQVNVALSDLLVDGHRVDIASSCRTRTSGTLDLVGKGYYVYADGGDQPEGTYAGSAGGLLSGTVDIPAFTGCTTPAGDDVSPILTNVVSGQGNPISVFQSPSSNLCFPQGIPGACVSGLKPLDVPSTRPQTQSPPPGPVPVPAS